MYPLLLLCINLFIYISTTIGLKVIQEAQILEINDHIDEVASKQDNYQLNLVQKQQYDTQNITSLLTLNLERS